MIYHREDILAIWKTIAALSEFQDSCVPDLSSADFKSGSTLCPLCRQYTGLMIRAHGRWGCQKCQKAEVGPGKGKSAAMYRIINDMEEYFGEVTTQKLFDPVLMQAFVQFTGLEQRKTDYIVFLSIVRAILSKEVGALGILGFLDKAQSDVMKLRSVDEPAGHCTTVK